MFVTGLPSSQVALVWSQPLGHRLRERVAAAGGTSVKVRVFDSVGFGVVVERKLAGRQAAARGEAKSCGSFGRARP